MGLCVEEASIAGNASGFLGMPFLTKRDRFGGRGCSCSISKLLSLSSLAGRIFASLPTAVRGHASMELTITE